jgi:hypothetical protein
MPPHQCLMCGHHHHFDTSLGLPPPKMTTTITTPQVVFCLSPCFFFSYGSFILGKAVKRWQGAEDRAETRQSLRLHWPLRRQHHKPQPHHLHHIEGPNERLHGCLGHRYFIFILFLISKLTNDFIIIIIIQNST